MKTSPLVPLTKFALSCSVALGLAACGQSAPSESDAREVVNSSLGDCKFFELKEFKKNNGIPTSDPNSYQVEVSYKVALIPDDDVKNFTTNWSTEFEKFTALNTEAINRAKEYNDKRAAYLNANSEDPEAASKFDQENQETAQSINSQSNEAAKIYNSLQKSPAGYFAVKISQECPNRNKQIMGQMINVKWEDQKYYTDETYAEFNQTLSMIKTDNGWQAAR